MSFKIEPNKLFFSRSEEYYTTTNNSAKVSCSVFLENCSEQRPVSNTFDITTKEIVSGTYEGDFIKKFGIKHYKYDDCDSNDLVNINGVKVHKKCKEAFEEMQKAAKRDGVNIYIVSGFRSKKYQIDVFKKKFKDKNNPTEDEMKARLRFSAPSGFSEHHTGLAIDINSTSQSFANTKEYKWLLENAEKYGFEISFPEGNHQGLGFEPWHWRFVGDDESKQIFEAARNEL